MAESSVANGTSGNQCGNCSLSPTRVVMSAARQRWKILGDVSRSIGQVFFKFYLKKSLREKPNYWHYWNHSFNLRQLTNCSDRLLFTSSVYSACTDDFYLRPSRSCL